MKTRKFSLIKSSLAVSIAMFFAKLVSFVRDMLLARELGATSFSDVVLLSTSLLLTMSTFLRSSFSAAYLPIATDAFFAYRDDRIKKHSFFGNIYGCLLIVGIIVTLLTFLFLDPILSVLAPGFKGESYKNLYQLMLLQLPVVTLSFLASVNDGNLKVINRFGISEISSAIIASSYIVYIFLSRGNITIIGLSITVIVAYIVSFTYRYYYVWKDDLVRQWHFNIKNNAYIKQIALAMLPFMLANGAREFNSLIDRAIASLLDAGSITMQTYASKLTVTEVGLIANAISMVIFAEVAKKNSQNDKNGMKSVVVDGIKFVNTLMFPCCILTIVFKNELISLLFGRGAFTQQNVNTTANIMMVYAIGMYGAGMEDILTRTMHATKHRKYPATVSIITVFLNTILNLILYKPFGVYGLAAASSFVLLIKIPFYISYVNKNIVKFEKEDGLVLDTSKIFIVSVISGGIAVLLKTVLHNYIKSNVVIIIISGLLSILVCFVGYCAIKNEYAIKISKKIKSIFA